MKIIQPGTIDKENKYETCHKCKCVFQYVAADIKSDRDGRYVICPQKGCGAFIAVT